MTETNTEQSLAASGVESTAPARTPIGTNHIEQVLDVGVQAVNDYKSIAANDNVGVKILKFMPTVTKLATALTAFKDAGPEIKDISGEEIKAIAAKYAPLFGVSGKIAEVIEHGSNIILDGFAIVKALKG